MSTGHTKNTLKNYQWPDKYGDWLGYRIKKIDRVRQEARVELTLREDHQSPAGRIHGGVISGLFDFACGAAAFSTMAVDDFCSTVELKVNYFRPLDAGDHLTARSRSVFRGKRLCVVHAQLYRRGDKDPVAMATATFNIVSRTHKIRPAFPLRGAGGCRRFFLLRRS